LNISNYKNYFFLVLILFFIGCGKRKSKINLAQSYYKMALLEVSEADESNLSYKKALDFINQAIDCEPKAEYLALKATLLFKLNQDILAYKFFNKVLSFDLDGKTRAEILNNKACLLAQVGLKKYGNMRNVDMALNIWKRLENNKDYLTPEVALVNQSRVYFCLKKYIKAKEKLMKAVYVSPAYLDAHYYLALVAHSLNDFSLAKTEIDTVLFLAPNHNGANKLKSILQKL